MMDTSLDHRQPSGSITLRARLHRPVLLVAGLALVLALVMGVAVSPAFATCWPEPGAGDVVNDADETVNVQDVGDECAGPPSVGLAPGRRSDEYFRDADRLWDNKKWITPSESIYNAFHKYDINYGQNFRCFDREQTVNGFWIEVQCD